MDFVNSSDSGIGSGDRHQFRIRIVLNVTDMVAPHSACADYGEFELLRHK